MFGMRHFGSHCEDRHAAGPARPLGPPSPARRRRHGRGMRGDGGDMMRAGRMLAQGDLRLLALALIAEQPRHGYEIIKVLEDKTEGWYAPSPGIVYPTLTYLEEAGYVTAQADGAKRLYTITGEGRAYLEENRAFVDAVLERLDAVGERVRSRERRGRRGPARPAGAAARPRRAGESARRRRRAAQGQRRHRGEGGRGAGPRRGGAEEELARHDLGAADGELGAGRRRAAAAVDHRDFDLGRTARRCAERMRHVELIALLPLGDRDAADLDRPAARPPRTRTTAPSWPDDGLRVTAMLSRASRRSALFAAAGIGTERGPATTPSRCRRPWPDRTAPRSTAPAPAAAAGRATRGRSRNDWSAMSCRGHCAIELIGSPPPRGAAGCC